MCNILVVKIPRDGSGIIPAQWSVIDGGKSPLSTQEGKSKKRKERRRSADDERIIGGSASEDTVETLRIPFN